MQNERTVHLHVKLETKELFQANLGSLINRLKVSAILYCSVFAMCVGVLILHAFHPTEISESRVEQFTPTLMALLAPAFVLPMLLWFQACKVTDDPRAKLGFDVTVSDSGYCAVGSTGRVELQWNAFLSARETASSFQLYVSKATFYIVPKRCFASETEMLLARDIIRAHIPRAKLLQ